MVGASLIVRLLLLILHTLAASPTPSIVFFASTYSMYPSGVWRLRSIVDKYEGLLSDTTARIDAQRSRILEFSSRPSTGAVASKAAARIAERFAVHLEQTVRLWQANTRSLKLLTASFELVYSLGLAEGLAACGNSTDVHMRAEGSSDGTSSTSPSYDDSLQIFAHLVRDWSAEGEAIRQALEVPILAALRKYLLTKDILPSAIQILLPGAGTGRLAYEITSQLGLTVEASDLSLGMLAVAAALSRGVSKQTIYPYIHDHRLDQLNSTRRYDGVEVPDVSFQDLQGVRKRLSFRHGEFLGTYTGGEYEACFDAVVTSFFIDTALNVIDYVVAIGRILRADGLWINHGPLHWHSQESIALALDELMELIRDLGFHIEAVHTSPETNTYYSTFHTHERSTKPDIYQPVLWIARKAS